MDVTKPGAAIARQAAMESQLLGVAEAGLRAFLAGVRATALGGTLYPPQVQSLWSAMLADMESALPRDVWDYVGEEYRAESLPDDVYTSVQVLFAAYATEFGRTPGPNDRRLQEELARVLSVDGFAVEQINASAGWLEKVSSFEVIRNEQALTAASWWDSLQETGSVWIKRIRRTTRTSATGMSGWLTITAIRLQDYSHKRWVTRHDDRVRHTHRLADGQTVPVDQPFIVGGFPLMHPGARGGEYGEIVQCRCVLIGVDR